MRDFKNSTYMQYTKSKREDKTGSLSLYRSAMFFPVIN